MILFKEAVTLAGFLIQLKQAGKKIGFVPTMGALHAGHISLIDKCKKECDITLCSIFINPTQFNDEKDFEKYPVTIGNDIVLLETAGCDVLFVPSVAEIYPEGTVSSNRYDLGELEFLLEGKFRPGHFQGVCQVVHRLLDIVQPSNIFMGQKDYQQCLVVKKLLQILHLPVAVTTVATFREPTGLAMSSRNIRLNNKQLTSAPGIYKMLLYIQEKQYQVSLYELKKNATEFLIKSGFERVDYVSVADVDTLQEIESVKKEDKRVALIAATIGDVRLIDNLILPG